MDHLTSGVSVVIEARTMKLHSDIIPVVNKG